MTTVEDGPPVAFPGTDTARPLAHGGWVKLDAVPAVLVWPPLADAATCCGLRQPDGLFRCSLGEHPGGPWHIAAVSAHEVCSVWRDPP